MRTLLHFLSLLIITSVTQSAQKPNLVLIFIDDMGYGDIGPFGSKLNRTPHLDRMAKEGMKLTSFYAAPVCSASRAQLMTGCYAPESPFPESFSPQALLDSIPTSTQSQTTCVNSVTPPPASASGTLGISGPSSRSTMASITTLASPTPMTCPAPLPKPAKPSTRWYVTTKLLNSLNTKTNVASPANTQRKRSSSSRPTIRPKRNSFSTYRTRPCTYHFIRTPTSLANPRTAPTETGSRNWTGASGKCSRPCGA